MNAITPCPLDDDPARTARHLRMCAEIADLAMQLARATAARALAEWTDPPAQLPSPPVSEPPSPQPPDARSPERAPASRANAAPGHAIPASLKPVDPALLFTRLATIVRACITLEARIAATTTSASPTGKTTAAETPRASALPADPRRALLREAFGLVTKHHTGSAGLVREASTRLDEKLAADPENTIEPGCLLIDICEELGIPLDIGKIPDKYLFSSPLDISRGHKTTEPQAHSPP